MIRAGQVAAALPKLQLQQVKLLHATAAAASPFLSSGGGLAARGYTPVHEKESVLFVCDLQEKFRKAIPQFDEVCEITRRLVQTADLLKMPIIVTEQYPEGLGHTVDEIGLPKGTPVVNKATFSMCTPPVMELLKPEKNKSVILVGIEAHVCCFHWIMVFLWLVYEIMGAVVDRTHRKYAFAQMERAGAILTTSENVIFGLVKGRDHEKFKDPSTTTYIWNDNSQQIAAPLVIYAVNLDKELSYNHTTGVFDAADISDGVVRGQIVTILSAKPFTTTISGDSNTVVTIFATGFDNVDANDKSPDKCRRVMQTNFDEMVSFQVNGPIISIYFSDFKGDLVNSKNIINTALTFAYDQLFIEPRGFVTSPGFIGCQSGQIYRSSLYGDLVQYSLSTPSPHFVYQAVYVNTDDASPVKVGTDGTVRT
ncbi:hypothetical protein PRIPAC_77902 [Pristionchus pacificus]|uniref:Isochorismatase domain-containing protein 1 n=1 Tax=Pristionchus pacificus TaxID=54126 RepID=A0A2A6CQS7_PRIPA|nr:hypothetical protein PRIPAC_77902 [Pristionchus pacificus]|eukprot:PDM80438.1 hypothetical protein PRIPAC_33017 [Pristionchus pacificus]